MQLGNFEEEIAFLQGGCRYGELAYDVDRSINSIITKHFADLDDNLFGVYLIRRQKDGKVIFIGRAGALDGDGAYKGNDIPKQLKSVRGGNIPARTWFRNLFKAEGAMTIEYFFLEEASLSPGLVEIALLQAHLNQYGHLPVYNKAL